MQKLSKSTAETEKIAAAFAKTLKAGDVVLLSGEMGAGKTAFVKGLAKGLGISAEVTSPTYAYMNDYEGKLFHFDFYRLSSGEDAEALGLIDYFYGNGICVLEWAENVSDVLPEHTLNVTIEKTGETERLFTFPEDFSI